jgi:hypothetical protein
MRGVSGRYYSRTAAIDVPFSFKFAAILFKKYFSFRYYVHQN